MSAARSSAKFGLVYSDIFRLHRGPSEHPERPERMDAISNALSASGLQGNFELLAPRSPDQEVLRSVHDPAYLAKLKRMSKKAGQGLLWLDNDTYVCRETYDTAMHALGGVEQGVDYVLSGGGSAFCAVRPPGHHAHKNRGGGFCVANNVAHAAVYSKARYGLSRVAILDWDLHHGDGTQSIFFRSNEVLYVSLHQAGLFPGTGAPDEIGKSAGKAFTRNFELTAGSTDADCLHLFDAQIFGLLSEFRPQLLLISAGFDAHGAEEMSSLRFSSQLFGTLTTQIMRCLPGVPILSVLEGGYCLQSLSESVGQHLLALSKGIGR